MYNYFMLVGVVTNDIELLEVGDGKKVVNLNLAVQRDFQNADGGYNTDYFRVACWEFVADVAKECLKKGTKVAIKGRMVTKKIELPEKTYYTTDLYGERIIAFSNKNNYDKFDKKTAETENEVATSIDTE